MLLRVQGNATQKGVCRMTPFLPLELFCQGPRVLASQIRLIECIVITLTVTSSLLTDYTVKSENLWP